MTRLPDGYEIGPARPDELGALPAIERAAGTLFDPEDLPPDAEESAPFPVSFYERVAAGGLLWVARTLSPPAPVGFAAVVLVDGSAHLQELDVHPSHGRRGLGRELVLHVARWAREAGHAALTLTTFRHVRWNAPFYAGLGFEELARPDQGPELRQLLLREAEAGLDPAKRIAMRLLLTSPARALR